MTNKTKIHPDFSKMEKPEKIPEDKKFEFKKWVFIKEVTKVLVDESLKREKTSKFLWNPVNWVFYKWWLITKVSKDIDWVTVEFDWNHSEKVIFLINIWEHAIDINELLKLEWQEVWVFRKRGKEGKDWNIISIKGIVVRK